MIVVNLMGGLGNQMFQYALGRQLSVNLKTDLLLDCTFLNTHHPLHIKREYELDVFKNIHARIATADELKKFNLLRNSKLLRHAKQIIPGLLSYHVVNEKTHAFDPAVLLVPDHSWMNGFWQSEKYFINIQNTIRSDFEFATPLQGYNKELAEEIAACNSVGIHVRRGDYTNPETLAFHGICTADYYYNAVNLLVQKTTIDKLFVFSDDSEWVRQNLTFPMPTTYLDHNTGKNCFEDMRLMSLCTHNIIANSSFSWWAAWLNVNPNKSVITPETWIADKSIDTKDVIPANWIKL